MPTHHAAIRLISSSSLPKQPSKGVQSSKGPRLLALSRFSINCSKLSKAVSLSSRVTSGSVERMADMESFMRSASLGPPKREARASGFSPRLVGGAASGSLSVVEEFSTLHLRSSFSPGSIMAWVVLCGGGEVGYWRLKVFDSNFQKFGL